MSRPRYIQALASLPNVGERLATRIHEELGVRSVAELVDAALTNRLQALRGIGSRREQQILEAAQAAVPDESSNDVAQVLRCPGCGHDGMEVARTSTKCPICQRQYSIDHGVIDLAPPTGRVAKSVTRRFVEGRFYARVYEEVMRSKLNSVIADQTGPSDTTVASLLELDSARAVLDVGCGTGGFLRRFAHHMLEVDEPGLLVGTDPSWPMLEAARNYLRSDGLHDYVRLVRADADRFPLQSGGFDRLHCSGALHLAVDIDGTLAEFARLLEPGGVCVIGTFVSGNGLLRRAVKRLAEIPTNVHWFSPGELERRMARVGLTVVSEKIDKDALTVKAFRT